MPPRLIGVLAPPVFILIWSTGFIVARLVAGQIGPFTFLAIRFAAATMVLAAIATIVGARWPRDGRAWRDISIAGLLMQAIYLGSIFWAVSRGLPSAMAALITGAQPLLTGLVARPLLGETVSARRWAGIVVGFAGIALVVAPRLESGDAVPVLAFVTALGGTMAMTLGTIWQKRIGARLDIASGTAIQYAAATPVVAIAAVVAGESGVAWTPSLWIGLAWSIFGLSVGAVGLFLWMIRQGAVTGVSTLLFLVPPVTAVMGFCLFGETLSPIQLLGMAVAALGVAVASRA